MAYYLDITVCISALPSHLLHHLEEYIISLASALHASRYNRTNSHRVRLGKSVQARSQPKVTVNTTELPFGVKDRAAKLL